MIKGRPLVAISVAPTHSWNFVDPLADRRQTQARLSTLRCGGRQGSSTAMRRAHRSRVLDCHPRGGCLLVRRSISASPFSKRTGERREERSDG